MTYDESPSDDYPTTMPDTGVPTVHVYILISGDRVVASDSIEVGDGPRTEYTLFNPLQLHFGRTPEGRETYILTNYAAFARERSVTIRDRAVITRYEAVGELVESYNSVLEQYVNAEQASYQATKASTFIDRILAEDDARSPDEREEDINFLRAESPSKRAH